MIFRYIIQSVLLFTCYTAAFCQNEKIDSVLSDWKSLSEPGGVVAVIKNREVVYKKAFGATNIESKTPNSINTKFDLASMAKQFTATCIALLEEQGKISVQQDIKKYYPQFSFGSTIRVSNLLDHTSGIREAYVLMVLSGKANLKGEVPEKYMTKEYLFKMLSKETDLNFNTGDEMVYTNINYILLGDIVEKVSGMKLSEFADSAIFKPLKMDNTFFNDSDSNIKTIGYYDNGKQFRRKTTSGGIVGDHNLISTIDDLIIWSNNFYDNRLGKGDPYFFNRIYVSSKLNNGEDTGYGYGMFTSTYKGLNQLFHGGDNGIHTSLMVRIPGENLVVIGLANSSRYNELERKLYSIVDLCLAARLPKSTPSKQLEYIKLDKSILSSKTGLFYFIAKNGIGQLRKVSMEGEYLFISDHFNAKGLKLNAINENYFVAQNQLGEFIHVRFLKDTVNTNVLQEVYLDQVNLQFTFVKPKQINGKVYAGTYINKSTSAKIKVRVRNHDIRAIKGITKIPLIALTEDFFFAPQNEALFLFDRDSNKLVTGLRINAQDFRNFKLQKIK